MLNGQTTTPPPPSPLTDASSAPALFASASASAGTPNTDLTSLPSDVSKLSLGPTKKSSFEKEGPTTTWPYSHDVALNDIPGIAFALDAFLNSRMVESEEYCHRNDPRKCVRLTLNAIFVRGTEGWRALLSPGNVCTLRRGSD